MSISIIGAGAIGSAIARKLARHGIEAAIANSRGHSHCRIWSKNWASTSRP
ncbi:NAD(P)-binding domain-containing protein [Pseudomonas viridiflava]|nr:NAD(P)-binding domain-containing protein [Pseudomonas viridiflava]